MKAAICYELGKPLVIEEVEIDPPEKDEVRVRMAATAICHSDIHAIRGDLGDVPPIVAGHESAGYIEEVGANVTSVKVGDPVVVSLLASCGKCSYCLSGMPHLCDAKFLRETKSPVHTKKGQAPQIMAKVGGFAEKVVVHESQVVAIPKDMPLDRASLLACGVITGFGAVVNRAQVKPMSSVVVMGCGGVGLNSVQGAAFAGAYPIIAVDTSDYKLKAAMDFGATHTVKAGETAVKEIRKLTDGKGADYVFVTVASSGAIGQGISMSGKRGMTVIIGLPSPKDILPVVPLMLVGMEKVITGGKMGSTNLKLEIPKMVALYKAKKLKLDELITNRYPLEKINEAIASVEKGEALRNVIVF